MSVGWDKRINMYSDSLTDVNIVYVQNPLENWSDDIVSINMVLQQIHVHRQILRGTNESLTLKSWFKVYHTILMWFQRHC